ncbi:TPR-like protein [Boletus coccyginus]|nr:TPR-like protein [Boletus coccyginus]
MMYLPVEQLHSRAASLVAKFEEGGGRSYIEDAIDLDREALELCPPGHPKRSVTLFYLALDLLDRYNQFGAMSDLEEASILDREALDLRPQGHPDRLMSLNNLSGGLLTLYKQLGGMKVLDEAIVIAREALDLCPQGHPNRSRSLNSLAVVLSTRYEQLGGMEDFDEAIILDREALDLLPQGHPDRSMSLNNLAVDLFTRYEQLGGTEDLDQAIALDREALDLCPQGHPNRSGFLDNLAVRLYTLYNLLGGMEDLDEAIGLDREALDLRPQGHADWSTSLNNLAVHLSTRYKQLGGIEDLGEAIVLDREALDLCPEGHPNRSRSLSNLAVRLCTRYNLLGGLEDLDEAIVLDRKALDLRPQRHPDRSTSLNNLAVHLSTRYMRLGEIEDLDEAVVLDREALGLRPQGHPNRSTSLNNLAFRLSARYKQLGVMKDLDEAIILDREALDLCPQGHPLRSDSLSNFARHLCDRFTHSGRLKDKEEVFSLYAQLAHVPQIVSSADLSATREWIRMAQHFRHPTILLAYETSLRLLTQHLATLPSLPQHLAILKNLTSSLAVDAFSACLHKCASAYAVELLEQGRGVFWSQLTRLRSPLDDLVISGPTGRTLAEKFTRLALLIRNALNSPGPDQHERLCHLNLAMHKVVTNVRELPGLSRFLLPSPFHDLQRAVSGGPVIIVSASKYSCDVIIVLFDRDPVHIPLQITQDGVRDLATELHTLTMRAKRVDVTRELAAFLRKLWEQVVSLIVDFLQTIHPSQSRIWWCPTAEFSVLPLHAAGPYRKGQRNLTDIYISSYTPTLTALIRARRCDPSNSAIQRKRFIAIGEAKAFGESELLSVGTELENIGLHMDGLATFTRIDGEDSCISRVVEELGRNDWVHLACHGLPNPKKPFESAFALRDGHFTIQHIIGCDLKNPEFAYLSACHTTVGDEESPDEVIHLASAMQFAGFRSVIGTMWAVDDGETNTITSTFYKYMVDESGRLDHTRAAFALNRTMKSVDVPFDQRILYIHLGV